MENDFFSLYHNYKTREIMKKDLSVGLLIGGAIGLIASLFVSNTETTNELNSNLNED